MIQPVQQRLALSWYLQPLLLQPLLLFSKNFCKMQ